MAIEMRPDPIKLELEPDCLDYNVCRTCLVPSASVPLFSEIDEDIGIMLVAIGGVAVAAGDGLPTAVCVPCAGSLRAAYAFRLRAQRSDRTLRHTTLIDADPVSPVSFDFPVKKEVEEDILTCQEDDYNTIVLRAEQEEISSKNKFSIDQTEKKDTKRKKLKLSPLNINAGNLRKKRGRPRGQNTSSRGYPAQCEECGVVRPNKSLLRIHQRSHTGERPFGCSDCGMTFMSNQALAKHIRRHKKNYICYCGECGKGFYRKPDLMLHLRKHSGEKPHICTECDRPFSLKHNLTVHMRNVHHADILVRETTATASKETETLQDSLTTRSTKVAKRKRNNEERRTNKH